jgi:hypothetical protein
MEAAMNFAARIDFAALMEPVALRLLGKPNEGLSKPPREVRFGNHGSMSVNYEAGTWFDHEAKVDGGILDLIKHKTGRNGGEAQAWLKREGISSVASSPPTTSTRTLGKVVATYDYPDENGALIFQVVRFDPKGFRQRRRAQPNDDPSKIHGGWVWEVRGVRQVPYRLPDLIKAVAAGQTIYIAEGEKDVDNLRALGFAATTNAGGTKKWQPDFSKFLRGADVVVLPDNDTEGREGGDMVAALLRGAASRIRRLDHGGRYFH